MKFLKFYFSLPIKYKLVFTVVFSVFVLFVIFTSVNYFTFTSNLDKGFFKQIEKQKKSFQTTVDELSEKALYSASIFANISQVKEAFLLIKQTKDDNCSLYFLNEEFRTLNEKLTRLSGEQTNIKFILPNKKIIYKFGSTQCAGEFDDYRETINKVLISKRPYSGFDIYKNNLIVNAIVPVFNNSEIIGLVEVSFSNDEFIDLINKYGNLEFSIVINNIESRDKSKLIDGNYLAFVSDNFETSKITELIKNTSKELIFTDKAVYGKANFESGIYTGYLMPALPTANVNNEKSEMFILTLIPFIVILIIIAFVVYFTLNRMVLYPLNILTDRVNSSSKGIINEDIKVKYEDEIGKSLKANNILMQGIKRASIFASKIGEGQLNEKFTALSDKDVLGNALLKLREELKKAKANENEQQIENEKRNWENKGLAKFGDILRQDNDNLNKLADNLLSNLVHYVDAVQGGIFLINDEETELDLVSSYAYNRKKFIEKQIPIKEGVLGACILEREYIYLKEVPENYIEVTSGLGDAKPTYLLLVPLIFNDNILGVFELAFLKEVDDYKINFCNNIAESIASTLTTVKVNKQTAILLEQTQQQTEEMSAQEEEMRQNMEEMQATQEESTRKENEFKGILTAIDNTLIRIELDRKGTVISINDNFKKLFSDSYEKVYNFKLNSIIDTEYLNEYNEAFNNALNNAESTHTLLKFIKDNKEIVWLLISITPVFNDAEITKFELLANNITKQKEIEEDLRIKSQELIEKEKDLILNMEELNTAYQSISEEDKKNKIISESVNKVFLTATINKQGLITDQNNNFKAIFKAKENYEFLKLIHKESINKFRKDYKKVLTENISGVYKYKIGKEYKWILSTFIPIFNDNKELETIVFIGFDNTASIQEKDDFIIDLNKL